MQARILIVEDEKDIADVLTLYIKREAMTPDWAETGEKALELIEHNSYDLILLDINLPGMDGYETLRTIRQRTEVPVIILSARQQDMDMIMGFGVGADDYVTKPFSPGVLMARLRAHLRKRAALISGRDKGIRFGDFELKPELRVLQKKEDVIALSPREMDLLVHLVVNPGTAFSQEQLYSAVWGNSFGDISTVSVHIQRLRKKIEDDPANPVYIQTRYGFGYYFRKDSR